MKLTKKEIAKLPDGQKRLLGLSDVPKKSKYRNEKTVVDGITFDSKKESERWVELVKLDHTGKIYDLRRQVRYNFAYNGVNICYYKADFCYYRFDLGREVVEDVKGFKTAIYKLKKKMMKAFYDIEIHEI